MERTWTDGCVSVKRCSCDTMCCWSCSLAVSGRPPVGLAADSWLSVLLSHWRNSSNSPWKPSAFTETDSRGMWWKKKKKQNSICYLGILLDWMFEVKYLLQGGFQQLLPLLGLEQEVLPALVELVQLIPQVTCFVAGWRLQQLCGSAVHGVDRGVMGEDVIPQNLGQRRHNCIHWLSWRK